MNYDGFVLAAVTAELRNALLGGRVQKIRQHNASDFTLEIRAPGRTHLLFISVDARFPRVYLTSSLQAVPPQAPGFCMVLRKHIQGAFAAAIEQVGFDRVLRMRTARHGEPERVLILEIMGKHSNLILADDTGRILGAAKHIGASVSRYRQILPGREYTPPPGSEKLNLLELDAAAIDGALRLTLERADPDSARTRLVESFSGFGPFLANEVVIRASSGGRLDIDRLRDELLGLADRVRAYRYEPVLITDEAGNAVMVYPIRSVQFPAEQQHRRGSINEPLDALFRSLVARSRLEEERAQTVTAIRRAIASRLQTMKSIERTIEESSRADHYRKLGELILANLHTITTGDRTAGLTDYFEPEMREIEVDLDEKLTPQQNAERYFARYRKARDAAATASARREAVARELEALEAAARQAESAAEADELREIRRELVERNLLRGESTTAREENEFAGHRIGRIRTPDDWEILYGGSSQANDYLTQKIARPNDVWLHARAVTGAHVIIRTAGRSGGVPRSVLEQAAVLAAKNSEARHSSLVPVDYTLRKYVRKPRGSAPGFVTYTNEKTIDVSPKQQ